MATKQIEIPTHITVAALADKLEISVTDLITALVKNGVMATMNDTIDFETAQIIVAELEMVDAELAEQVKDEHANTERPDRTMTDEAERPPVIAVMGHVDHGKTTLLDAIRGADTVSGEAGGITQHISAYQIEHKGRKVTFLDTPGHEAFASLRQHGAQLTDLVILVVAADDGVKPQTTEAIKYAQKAGVKIMVAINKIDKPDANTNRVMTELAEHGLNPEQWGGDTLMVEVSALKKQNLEKLIDMAFLITDVEELTADAVGLAQGLVIESHMEQGRGAVVSVLVEHGRLHQGDYISAGSAAGKVRTLDNYKGEKLEVATASTPAVITGLKEMPSFGVVFQVHDNEKAARATAANYQETTQDSRVAVTGAELLAQMKQDRDSQELPVVVKADVRGSVTSVVESIESVGSDEVLVRVVGTGVGSVNESDVSMAAASHGIIYGFNIDVPVAVKRLAARESVPIKVFNVIYELIDDVKEELERLLVPEVVEENVGRLLIKGVFKTSQKEIICGGEVTKGKVVPDATVKMFRDDEEIGTATVQTVQRGTQSVKEMAAGEMCGLQLKTEAKINLKEDDRLEFFTVETRERTL
jgi:translation initiation factor IF-2